MIRLFTKTLNPTPELQALRKDARAYVKANYVPRVSYCIVPEAKEPSCSLKEPEACYSAKEPETKPAEAKEPRIRFSYAAPDEAAARPAEQMIRHARKDPSVYDSIEMADLYHQWETRNSVRKSFSGEVLRILDENRVQYVDFYKRAWLDKKMFYKIKSDFGYQPSKETAYKCCFGLKLNTAEADALLQLAGYAFSPSSSRDLVMRFCIEHGITDLREVNYILCGLGENELK